jgi:hypothetical protein
MKFREELNNALQPVNDRLDRLEEAVFKAGPPVERVTPEVAPTEGGEAIAGERMDVTTLREYILELRYLNIALRGYGQLLNELGLPKDMKQAIYHIENLIMAMLRLMQLIRMIDWMMSGTYAMGPFGWLVAGGFFSGMLAYSGKTLGGF